MFTSMRANSGGDPENKVLKAHLESLVPRSPFVEPSPVETGSKTLSWHPGWSMGRERRREPGEKGGRKTERKKEATRKGLRSHGFMLRRRAAQCPAMVSETPLVP